MKILDELDSRGAKIFTADDNFVLSAQKCSTGTRGRLPFQLGWQAATHKKYIDGEPVVAGYFNPALGKKGFISQGEFEKLSLEQAAFFKPHYVRELVTTDKAVCSFNGNNIQLSLPKKVLMKNPDASRYTLAFRQFQEMHKAGIIAYSGSGRTLKHTKEALRYHFKKKFHLMTYEHNLYLRGGMGRWVLDAAKKYAVKNYSTTAYLKNNPKAEKMVKVYNVSALEDGSNTNGDDDWYKIEITFQNQYFRRHPSNVNHYLTQRDIQNILKPQLMEAYGAVLGMVSGRQRMRIRQELDMPRRGSSRGIVERVLS